MEHLYVHVPFCSRRCSYCDFAIAVRRTVPADDYLKGLDAEFRHRVPRTGPISLKTIYVGGGTPSKLGPGGVSQLLDVLLSRPQVEVTPGAEVTLEANPEDVTVTAAAGWRAAGVNRLSLGAQSFDEAVLRWMHRTHDASAIGRAVENARHSGFEDISLDLIFALPTELARDWQADLDRALGLAPDHMSLYGLTVEPHTPLGKWTARGDIRETPEGRYAEEFLAAHEALGAAGFEHYEVSNFARAGKRSRHNSSYWRRVPYLGVGPSAHSFDGATRRWNVREYEHWRAISMSGEDPLEGAEGLTPTNVESEGVYLGLRTSEGLTVRPEERHTAAQWVDAGWGTLNDHQLRLSAEGWLRLDSLAAALTATRSR